MQFLFMALFAGLAVLLDQLSKLWTVHNIALASHNLEHWPALQTAFGLSDAALSKLPDQIKAIPGIFHFTHTLNEGAAFSAFEGAQWLFVILFLVLTVFIIWEFPKKRWPFTTFERWCIVAIYAGGIGNMIDRLRFGFVIDMIEVEFMNFAVFNVADSVITCGAILLLCHLVLFNKEFWKDETKK